MERVRLGAIIADARVAAGLTQRQLADKCGVSHSNIAKVEKGRYNASTDIINRILAPLGKRLYVF